MQWKDNREYYVDNCESGRKADELLYLLDMAADGMSGLSERERLRLLVMMEEDALDGSPVYNRWFERRRGEAALSSDAEEADPADMERIIRNTMLHIRREKSRMKLRRTFISVAKIAALFVFAAFSIITYEYIKQLKLGAVGARVTKYKNYYTNLKVTQVANGYKVSGLRQPSGESYRLPVYFIVQKNKNGKWQIIEESMNTKVQKFLKYAK